MSLQFRETAARGRAMTPFWGRAKLPESLMIPGLGFGLIDDFVNFGVGATDALNNYKVYIDTGNTITALATEKNGVVRLLTDATDNDAPVLSTGGNTAGAFAIESGVTRDLFFEARVRVSSALLTEQASFVGLTEEARAVDNGVLSDNPDTNIATAMADIDYIGFGNFTNAAPQWAFIYKKAGGTDQVIVAAAEVYALNTWSNLAFWVDSHNDMCHIYVNRTRVGGFDVSDAGSTNFPSGEELAMTISTKNGTGAAKSLDIDYWACVQLETALD